MILDSKLLFADEQELTATAVGTNVLDLTVARSVGNGEPLAVVFVVDVAADQTTGDEDYTFEVEYSSVAAQTSGYVTIGRRVYESGTPDVPAQNADLLVAGYKFAIPIPPTGAGDDERYIGIRSTLAGTTPTITITAFLQPMSMIDASVSYTAGYTVT